MKNNRMSLEAYKHISRLDRLGLSCIKKADAAEAGYPTIKAAKDAVSDLRAKREARKAFREWAQNEEKHPLPDRIENHFERVALDIIHAAGAYPQHYSVNVKYGGTFGIVVNSYQDWDGYGKRCKYPMTIYTIGATIPTGGVRIERGDGISMIVNRRMRIGSLTRFDGLMISRGRKIEDIRLTPCTMIDDGLHTAHGDTPQKAMAAYKRKIAAIRRAREQELRRYSPDEIIGARDYMRITGACEPGTRAFCEEMGLDFKTARMTVAEALRITSGRYGHSILAARCDEA